MFERYGEIRCDGGAALACNCKSHAAPASSHTTLVHAHMCRDVYLPRDYYTQ